MITEEPSMSKPLGLSMGTQISGCSPQPQQPAPGKSGYLNSGRIHMTQYIISPRAGKVMKVHPT